MTARAGAVACDRHGPHVWCDGSRVTSDSQKRRKSGPIGSDSSVNTALVPIAATSIGAVAASGPDPDTHDANVTAVIAKIVCVSASDGVS